MNNINGMNYAQRNIDLQIQSGSNRYRPCLEGEIQWETERKGAPGKLTFQVMKDPVISFQEGDPVIFRVDDTDVFLGFVFTKSRSKDNLIKVTAYDQLRYFKNKDTYVYQNKTADQLLAIIAEDFRLQCGTMESTGFAMNRLETDKTLFDIMQSVLDLTLENTGRLYVLYDDFGKLVLRNIDHMKLDLLISEYTIEDFDYSSSIDRDTYNQIKLYQNKEDSGIAELYIAKSSRSINNWGLLQYFEELGDQENGKEKADALLSLYNQKTRTLTVSGALGDLRVRGGSSLPVTLNLGDIDLGRNGTGRFMVVEKVKHTLTAEKHSMEMTLRGGEFIV